MPNKDRRQSGRLLVQSHVPTPLVLWDLPPWTFPPCPMLVAHALQCSSEDHGSRHQPAIVSTGADL